jgi:murein DD-endopeptidase MepM/ murein hydrolase activator NlpD
VAIDRSEQNSLLLALREHLDPRRILPNTRIRVRRWAEDRATRAVELQLNADSTVVLRKGDVGWESEIEVTPTTVDTVYLAGRMGPGGSLYQTITGDPDLGLKFADREALVWDLAHIYGWELDFMHDVRPGDSFRVVYERDVRPDGTTRNGRVLIAEIVSQGRVIPAIYFDPGNDNADYFTREGKSLRLAFLRYPLDFPRITSNFSWHRYHPILKRSRPHLGTDFGARRGTPIRSTADGTVAFAGWDGGYGNMVRINHGNGYETRYAHMGRFAPGIRRGRRVEQGEIIGYVGDTGLATAPHLHYEFRQYGRPVNPRTVRVPSAPPVPSARMEAFREVAQERTVLLASTHLSEPGAEGVPAN